MSARFIYSSNINNNLFQVAALGKASLTKKLLEKGAKVELSWNEDGYNAFHIAIKEGHLRVVNVIIDSKVDLNIPTKDGYPPILLAVLNNHEAIVMALIEGGADINAGNLDHLTPLHVCAKYGYLRILKMLLHNNADLNIASKEGLTPLHIAVESNQLQIAELLISRTGHVNFFDNTQEIPLHIAVLNENVEMTNLLLAYGAEVDQCDSEMFSALHIASSLGHKEIVQVLLRHGANINHQSQTLFTPLMEAITNEHEDLALYLLQIGVDINLCNINGDNSLILATEHNLFSVVKYITHSYANAINIHTANDEGFTAFLTAAYHGYNHLLDHFLQFASSLPSHAIGDNIKGTENPVMMMLRYASSCMRTSLHWAVTGNHPSTVTKLLSILPRDMIYAQDSNGATALYLAAEAGYFPIVRRLVEFCGPVSLPNNEGLTPAMIAEANQHDKIVYYLSRVANNQNRVVFCQMYYNLLDQIAVYPGFQEVESVPKKIPILRGKYAATIAVPVSKDTNTDSDDSANIGTVDSEISQCENSKSSECSSKSYSVHGTSVRKEEIQSTPMGEIDEHSLCHWDASTADTSYVQEFSSQSSSSSASDRKIQTLGKANSEESYVLDVVSSESSQDSTLSNYNNTPINTNATDTANNNSNFTLTTTNATIADVIARTASGDSVTASMEDVHQTLSASTEVCKALIDGEAIVQCLSLPYWDEIFSITSSDMLNHQDNSDHVSPCSDLSEETLSNPSWDNMDGLTLQLHHLEAIETLKNRYHQKIHRLETQLIEARNSSIVNNNNDSCHNSWDFNLENNANITDNRNNITLLVMSEGEQLLLAVLCMVMVLSSLSVLFLLGVMRHRARLSSS